MRCFYIQAPFGAFRPMMAGSFRATAGFITPSAAYGLLLNVAGIEMRHDDGRQPMTLIQKGLPMARLAIGALRFPTLHTVYQQLHNYPVGSSAKQHAPATRGTKYNIAPARRAILSDISGYIAMDGNDELEQAVVGGLAGDGPPRYGVPFLGENNFLLDRLEPVEDTEATYWFEQIDEHARGGIRDHVTRMTVYIDRYDMSQTRSALFAPAREPTREIPATAWVEVGYP